MADRPVPMSHEERQRIIRAPISFFSRHSSRLPWGGSAIEAHPLPRRAATPQDQDVDPQDQDDDESE